MLLCYKNFGREKVDHDILSEDDFFEQLKKEKRQPTAQQKEESEEEKRQSTPEEPLETDLFEMEQEEKQPAVEQTPPGDRLLEPEEEIQAEVGEEPPIEPHPFEEESFAAYDDEVLGTADFSKEEEPEKVEEEPPPAKSTEPPPKIFVPEDKVEDEKLPGLSKKPVIIWTVVIIVVIAGILMFFYMFSGEKKAEPEQKAEQIQQPATETPATAEDPLLAKQKAYLGQLAAANSQNFAIIANLFSSAEKNNVQISSMLFYGDELSVEIFGKDRNQLAKALMDIRTSLKTAGLKVVASDVRPGDGITSVLSFKLPQNAGSGEINAKLTSVNDASQWLKMLAQQFSVSISPVKEVTSKTAQFNLKQHRLQFKVKGSYENCVRFFSALGQSNRNFKLHKMAFSSLDQKSFSKAKYQADFVADLYF